jgi:hypothetical protein
VLSVLHGQKKKTEEQKTRWLKEKDRRTDNTMVKRKRQKNRQHDGQKKKTEGPSSSDYTFSISWPWCCLSVGF